MNYHPLTNIHPEAKIAENVIIEPFVTVEKDTEIGEGSHLRSGAVIMAGARIGKNCNIFSGAVIAGPPQDLKFQGEDSKAVIGDNATIRECATVNRGTQAENCTTEIGKNCLLMAYAHVAHDCLIGDNCILANGVQLAGHVKIQDNAIIGGLSAVHQFSTIGAHVMLGGGSFVNKDIPPFIKVARRPISFAGINTVGLKRRGFTDEKINEIRDIYRAIYQQGHGHSKAADLIKNDFAPSPERDLIIDFIKNSTIGIVKSQIGK